MNIEETARLLRAINGVYPMYANNRDVELTNAIWQKAFEDKTYEVVSKATMAYFQNNNSGFPPSIGQINHIIMNMQDEVSDRLTPEAAWSLVYKAIKRGYYNYPEEYAKLPKDVQRAIGEKEQLREWAIMDEDTVQSVIASNFQRSYKQVADRTRQLQMLSKGLYEGFRRDVEHHLIQSQQEEKLIAEQIPPALPRCTDSATERTDEQMEINKQGFELFKAAFHGWMGGDAN